MYTNTHHQLFACNSGLKNVHSLKLKCTSWGRLNSHLRQNREMRDKTMSILLEENYAVINSQHNMQR